MKHTIGWVGKLMLIVSALLILGSIATYLGVVAIMEHDSGMARNYVSMALICFATLVLATVRVMADTLDTLQRSVNEQNELLKKQNESLDT